MRPDWIDCGYIRLYASRNWRRKIAQAYLQKSVVVASPNRRADKIANESLCIFHCDPAYIPARRDFDNIHPKYPTLVYEAVY